MMLQINNIDSEVDVQLERCVLPQTRQSFFLFAGAGSGKTHSLITLLNKIKDIWGKKFLVRQKKVAVITYTNAATNEILNRLNYSPLFQVSTIHSFVWEVIKIYQEDVKKYYYSNKQKEIDELQLKQQKAKSTTTKTYLANEDKIQKYTEQIKNLEKINKFIYNPNGNNLESNSLNHAEVIKISAQMIKENELLQKIIAQQYPFLLIDESQDTKSDLVDAFLMIQQNYADIFTLGLLGDQKQRIYADGKANIIESIPDSWSKPVKRMNYRCGKRIIQLANNIGLDVDQYAEQQPREDAAEGCVRLFISTPKEADEKELMENRVMEQMAVITDDKKWQKTIRDVKILCLEHHMAANRLGFLPLYETFAKVEKYSMALLQGTQTELELFSKRLFPIYESQKGDGTDALNLLKKYSPLLSSEARESSFEELKRCKQATMNVCDLIDRNESIQTIVSCLIESKLLRVDDVIGKAVQLTASDFDDMDNVDEELQAWTKVMELPINMMRMMINYIERKTQYDTHQGVKGLEFERVLVIVDDAEAKGFMFSYDKLFNVKELSPTDRKNFEEGKETAIERTTRLLYVTCTRAKKSLALVMYTNDPQKVMRTVVERKWFAEEEIIPLE